MGSYLTKGNNMDLVLQISEDIKKAMKAGEKAKLNVLRALATDFRKGPKDAGRDPTPDDVLTAISRGIKQRQDSFEQFEKAGRDELAKVEKDEIAILQDYLPEQLTDDELESLVDEAIKQSGASSPKEMGKVMGILIPKTKGKADGKKISGMVSKKLAG